VLGREPAQTPPTYDASGGRGQNFGRVAVAAAAAVSGCGAMPQRLRRSWVHHPGSLEVGSTPITSINLHELSTWMALKLPGARLGPDTPGSCIPL